MTKYSIELNIQKPARSVGITTGKQFADATKLGLATAYAFWREEPTRLDLATLATLCEALRCEVGDILLLRKRKKPNGTTKTD